MAADRAAELTEAYRILSDEGRRPEYDRGRASAPPAPAAGPKPAPADAPPPPPASAGDPRATDTGATRSASAQFTHERASRDVFVRKAAVGRLRQALCLIGGYDESPAPGFDVAFAPKAKLFGRGKGARLLGRFVGSVDAASIASAWASADKSTASGGDEVCVFLMGSSMAPPRQLAEAIAGLRRKPTRSAKIVLIPVDARNWDAHMPTDAPAVAKTLLERLRSGS